ncbi:hypothetical protein [Phenylobacterium sp. J367]|uniref:hypothetical protein n=1 Tax=Phenylobacterium sp. J367 TaxID=2898435 RepID=UPI00215197C2|nr:hypothetical protein [Phenylobacterium sp. J367]MCR5878160.1 hypothetical protein [Phenylobacterium sp. J367]
MQMETGSARGDLSRSVDDDLGAIFRPVAAEPAPAAAQAQAFEPRAVNATGRAARFGGIAAAALAGLAVGAVLMDPRPVRTVAAPTEPHVPIVVAEAPQPPPRAELPAPVFTPPPGPVTPPVQSAAVAREAPPARIVKANSKTKAKAKAAGGCERLSGGARARCGYPQVLAADRQLRRAYAQATRAGVERGRLVSYRNRWANLRHRADDQPTRVAAAYGDMARDLSRLAREARS